MHVTCIATIILLNEPPWYTIVPGRGWAKPWINYYQLDLKYNKNWRLSVYCNITVYLMFCASWRKKLLVAKLFWRSVQIYIRTKKTVHCEKYYDTVNTVHSHTKPIKLASKIKGSILFETCSIISNVVKSIQSTAYRNASIPSDSNNATKWIRVQSI